MDLLPFHEDRYNTSSRKPERLMTEHTQETSNSARVARERDECVGIMSEDVI